MSSEVNTTVYQCLCLLDKDTFPHLLGLLASNTGGGVVGLLVGLVGLVLRVAGRVDVTGGGGVVTIMGSVSDMKKLASLLSW